ncbi:hypothetical protein [Cohnella sp. GCM10027633]|uniref:hypothetical protein n=1 Tax=unclassified Cohnella TaxID=2636738 RepID=UPI00362B5A79
MKVWKITPKEKRITLKSSQNTNDFELIVNNFMGNRMKSWWNSITLESYKKGNNTDYFYLASGIPVFSSRVVEVLTPLIGHCVEFLCASHEDFEIFIANVFVANDVVDFDRSSIVTTSQSGLLESFDKICFISENVSKYPIFKVVEDNICDIYVNDDFVNLVHSQHVKGFTFTEVWDSEISNDSTEESQELYKQLLSSIESYRGPKYKWDNAVQLAHNGEIMQSGHWQMQVDYGIVQLYVLNEDCKYYSFDSMHIPPGVLLLEWQVKRS